MSYSSKAATDFWFEFDDVFLFNRPSEVTKALSKMIDSPHDGLDLYLNQFQKSRRAGTYPKTFIEAAKFGRRPDGLHEISDLQWRVMDSHFGGNLKNLRLAFEEFGQGVLFDDRRQIGDKVHKMDTGPGPAIGYHRWHSIIRAAVFAGVDSVHWLKIDRLVGLAWEIQSASKPVEDKPNNPRLGTAHLNELRKKWTALRFDQIDDQFESFPFPPKV